MTPLPNTTDKTHGERMLKTGRRRERMMGGRQAAEGKGCDVTAQYCHWLPQKGQRQQRGAVSHGETERDAGTERERNSGHLHTKLAKSENASLHFGTLSTLNSHLKTKLSKTFSIRHYFLLTLLLVWQKLKMVNTKTENYKFICIRTQNCGCETHRCLSHL